MDIKWKNLKNKEKKFIIVSIIYLILLTIGGYLFYYSNYVRILKYPKILEQSMILPNLYIKNDLMSQIMENTPKAVAKARQQYYIFLGLLLITYPFLALPIKWYKPPDEYGSARFATFDDLGLSGFFKPTHAAKAFEVNLLQENGVVLGEFQKRILRDNGKTHVLIAAPTRTGKGVSIIIPTLVDSWSDSVLVLDIKGENYQKTAGYRQQVFNNKILKFSPKKKDSCKFNPLFEIRYLTDKEIEDAKVIAVLIVIDDSSSDPFWGIAGSDFCCAAIIYTLYKNRGKGSLGDVVSFITDPSGPLEQRMQEILQKPLFDYTKPEDLEIKNKLLEIYHADEEVKLINKGFHPFVSNGFADTLSKGDKTMASIIATAKAKLSVFETPTVKYNTSSSDFKIIDLMASKQAHSLYIVIEPGDLQTLAPLLRILCIQCLTILTPEIDYTGKNENAVRFNKRLLMLLDEFPSIGKMEIMEKGIGYVGGYGIKMMLVVQSLDQLNKIYTKDNAFLSNCQTQVFYTANENQTAEYIEKTLGTKTIISKSYSGTFWNRNYTYNKIARSLIKVEEMRRFGLDKILLIIGGKPPIISNKILYFIDKRYKDKVDWEIKEGDISEQTIAKDNRKI